jgi:hypothetical protein
MDEIGLPQHIVNRIERRWKSRFAQTLGDWRRPQRAPLSPAAGNHDPLRSPQVRRLLEGSLRPPTLLSRNSDRARTVCGSRNFPREVGLPDVFHF